MSKVIEIDFPSIGKFTVKADTQFSAWRASVFLSKEPGTLEWLRSFDSESILIDVMRLPIPVAVGSCPTPAPLNG